MAMTSLERIRRAARLELSEVVPVAPYMGNHGAKVGGVLISDYCRDGKLMAEAQIRAWEIYGQDVVVAQSDNYYIAEGFGVKTRFMDDSTPVFDAPAIMELADIYKLRVPDPYRDGRMPVYLEAVSILANTFKDDVCIRGAGTGPFSLASHLMGTERFLYELAMAEADEDEEALAALAALMELTSDALIAFSRALMASGAHLVMCGDSLASISVISPSMYKKWAFPYEKKVFSALREECEQRGAYSILHVCGKMTPVLEAMADTGAHILEIDSLVDLAEAKARVGDRVCLMGNLNPTEILLQGTPEKVDAAATAAIEAAGRNGGFILGSGCEVPIFAPQENLKAMIAAARRHRGG